MNRDKNLPLTETTYYVLLALLEPAHGYLIMQKVEELSNHCYCPLVNRCMDHTDDQHK